MRPALPCVSTVPHANRTKQHNEKNEKNEKNKKNENTNDDKIVGCGERGM